MNSPKYFSHSLNSQQPPKQFFSYAQTDHQFITGPKKITNHL